jgi:hypothetical protein
MADPLKKPLRERGWFQAVGGGALLALLLAAFILENYNYRLLWVAMPVGFAAASAWIAKYGEAARQSRPVMLFAALLLMPFFGWPVWVIANIANKYGLNTPVERQALVTSHEESFLHSGRGTRRYALTVTLDGTGQSLEFIVLRKADEYAQRVPVCEWKGLLGFATFTLGRCQSNHTVTTLSRHQPVKL